MSVALSFPDGTYNTSNKPSVATLKNDLSLIEDDLNAHEADETIHFTRAQINAPQGFLINGKIVVTDAAGITVAIKTLAGTDPSATDPVYVRIGNTVRTISAALSVSKADGTNWCNAGSAELATKEIDYFAYLGYNTTDGVVIGFSRYPGANSYDDFSVTTTNEKYCAISTTTNAAATDYYEVIGRFAATLSGGAGYTWSVPTFTAKNLIQRPIYENRSTTPGMPELSTRLSSKIITATRDLTAVSGDVSYTGVGFCPTSIHSQYAINGSGVVGNGTGFSDSVRGSSALNDRQNNATSVRTTGLIYSDVASGALQYAVVKSYDADGFTLTWTKTGSPTGTLNIAFLCYR